MARNEITENSVVEIRPETGAPSFGELLRHRRSARRMSQLTLAAEAEISSRHLSFLETGRARPSRQMMLLLAGVLDVPLRDQNAPATLPPFPGVLRTAGHSAMRHGSRLHSGRIEFCDHRAGRRLVVATVGDSLASRCI